MSKLLELYSKNIKESSAVTETVSVTINKVLPTKDDRKVMLQTDKGTMFAWKDSIKGIKNVDALPNNFKAEVTLIEKTVGEQTFINVTSVKIDLESLGKYGFVASIGAAVAL